MSPEMAKQKALSTKGDWRKFEYQKSLQRVYVVKALSR